MKQHEQVQATVTKASRMLRMLRSAFVSRCASVWLPLNKTYERHQLEFAVAAWNPLTSTDIDRLECVQRKVTRLVRNARGLKYPPTPVATAATCFKSGSTGDADDIASIDQMITIETAC